MDILIGLGGLLVGVGAIGGWFTLRAKRDNLDADSDHKHVDSLLAMWESARDRCTELEEKHSRCHGRKRALEAAALEYGMPLELVQEALQ